MNAPATRHEPQAEVNTRNDIARAIVAGFASALPRVGTVGSGGLSR